jgi:hypothetical protein
MKAYVAALALGLVSTSAFADCAASNFAVEGFQVSVNPRASKLGLSGKLVNHCGEPAGAQLRITGKDGAGKVVSTQEGWPAGTDNVKPGDAVTFDLGPMFKFQPDMTDFAVSVVNVRKW